MDDLTSATDIESGDPSIDSPNNGGHWALFPSTGKSLGKTTFHVPNVQAEDFSDHGYYSIISLPVGVPILGYYTPTKYGSGRFKLQDIFTLMHPSKDRMALLTPKGPVWEKPRKCGVFPKELDSVGYGFDQNGYTEGLAQRYTKLLHNTEGLWLYAVVTMGLEDPPIANPKNFFKRLKDVSIPYIYGLQFAIREENGEDLLYRSTIKAPWLWYLMPALFYNLPRHPWVFCHYYSANKLQHSHRQPISFLGWHKQWIKHIDQSKIQLSNKDYCKALLPSEQSAFLRILPRSKAFVLFHRNKAALRRLA